MFEETKNLILEGDKRTTRKKNEPTIMKIKIVNENIHPSIMHIVPKPNAFIVSALPKVFAIYMTGLFWIIYVSILEEEKKSRG